MTSFKETEKTKWVESDILPVLMDPSFGPSSVKEITERLVRKNQRKGWSIEPKDLFKYITNTAMKNSEPGRRFIVQKKGEPKPVDILNCRIGIVQKSFPREENRVASLN